jgi:hypothetical protein
VPDSRRPELPALASGKTTLGVMAAAFLVFGLSLVFQPHRWGATPAYGVLLQVFPARVWGGLFLASGTLMGASVWQFQRRWLLVGCLTMAFAMVNGWLGAFVARYLTNGDTTPVTWVSWAVYDYLLLRVALTVDFFAPPAPEPAPGPAAVIAEARAAARPPKAE